MRALPFLARHAWAMAGLLLMAVIPIWVIHEGKQFEKENLAKDLEWVEWYPGVVELNRQRGRIVWLQSDHDWGLVSKVNMERLLFDEGVVRDLRRLKVMMVKIDCTNFDAQVVAEMERLGTRALPFSFIASARPSQPLIKMPELIEPSDFREALRLAEAY